MQHVPKVRAFGAGDDVELVAALRQQRADGLRGVLGELARHHGTLHTHTSCVAATALP